MKFPRIDTQVLQPSIEWIQVSTIEYGDGNHRRDFSFGGRCGDGVMILSHRSSTGFQR
jgi:hypothetical protein